MLIQELNALFTKLFSGSPSHTTDNLRRRPSEHVRVEELEDRRLMAPFNIGDVLAGVQNGVNHFNSNGNLIQFLQTGSNENTGMAFDVNGNLYVTKFSQGQIVRFDPNGNPLGPIGSGFSNPESIVFNPDGDFFVGDASQSNIKEFDPSGNLVATFNVAIEDRGTDWVQLAPDQSTLVYTSEGTTVFRFDPVSNTQLSPLATGLPGRVAYALRFIPSEDGTSNDLLVADTENIVRLNASGQVIQTYDIAGENNWFALNVDPDGTSFWSANRDTNLIAKFDISTGAVLQTFPSGSGFTTAGLAIVGEILNPRSTVPPVIVTGAESGAPPEVKVYNGSTNALLFDFLAFDPSFTGGVHVATGDINDDGVADIVVGAGPGGGPHVKVFDGNNLALLQSFYAYAPNFTGGVNVAVGDVNDDGIPDIVTGAGPGGGPHVKAFSGKDGALLKSFFAFDKFFLGGVSVAAGDVNQDGRDEIVAGAGPGGGPHVRVFNGITGQQITGALGSFFAFDAGFTGGVNVGIGHFSAGGLRANLMASPASAGGPRVEIYDRLGNVLRDFMAFPPFLFLDDGVVDSETRVSGVNRNGSGPDTIVVSFGPHNSPKVYLFDFATLEQIDNFFAFDPTYAGGVTIASL